MTKKELQIVRALNERMQHMEKLARRARNAENKARAKWDTLGQYCNHIERIRYEAIALAIDCVIREIWVKRK